MRSIRYQYYDPMKPIYYLGLDLGQYHDYTALSIMERSGEPASYAVKGLKRYPLGTSYAEIIESVKRNISRQDISPNCLAVDATGPGAPVNDLLTRAGLRLIAITITGGDKVSCDEVSWRVPKRDLVTTLQILFQSKRLKIASDLPDAMILTEELHNFSVRISNTGHDSYGAGREGVNDDLVLSVALACWASERGVLPPGFKKPRNRTGREGRLTDNTLPNFNYMSEGLLGLLF